MDSFGDTTVKRFVSSLIAESETRDRMSKRDRSSDALTVPTPALTALSDAIDYSPTVFELNRLRLSIGC